MGFREIKYGSYKKEIRSLLRQRARAKDNLRRFKSKVIHYQNQVKLMEDKHMKVIDADLDMYLKRAGN